MKAIEVDSLFSPHDEDEFATLARINMMGEEGWELCAVAGLPGGRMYYFKREKAEL